MSGASDAIERATARPMASRAGQAMRRLRYPIAFLTFLGAFLADLHTGYELSSSLFYVVPVVFTAWFVGRGQSLVIAVASSVAWFASQRLGGVSLSKPDILYANAGVECTIYLIAAWAVARVHTDRAVERRLSALLTDANAALEREFLAVGELQRGLLPQELPRVNGYAWEVHYQTSTRAGGDYYDAFPLPDGRVGVILADAAGHGAAAAVLMAMARALLGADQEPLFLPDQVLTRLNRKLGRILPDGWFLTACYIVVDPAHGRLKYSLAGQEGPLIVRARDGAVDQLRDGEGLPLGPFQNRTYEADSAELRPGDTLILFTDGVTESMSPSRELFGIERLRKALEGTAGAKLEDVKLRLLASLDHHCAGAPLADDTTILLLRREARSGA